TPTPVNNKSSDGMAGMDMSGMDMGHHGSGAAPGRVVIPGPRIRAPPAPGPSGGYFTLHNGGSKPVVLTGASSPGCGMLMLHKSEDKGGMSAMSDVAEVPVAAGANIEFSPGGFHLMCMDAKPVIKPGATVPVT